MDYSSFVRNAHEVIRDNPILDGETFRVTHIQRTERSSTAVCLIQAGGGLRPHIHHDHDELIVFLEGEAEFRLGDEVRKVSGGDVAVVPAGTIHATMNAVTDVVIAAVFAPDFDLENEDREFVD